MDYTPEQYQRIRKELLIQKAMLQGVKITWWERVKLCLRRLYLRKLTRR